VGTNKTLNESSLGPFRPYAYIISPIKIIMRLYLLLFFAKGQILTKKAEKR